MADNGNDTQVTKGGQEGQQPENQSAQQPDSGESARARTQPVSMEMMFDPRASTRVALLRLARNWRDVGSTYQALHAYEQVLIRYQGTGAANAAAEELISMAEEMENQGKLYTALNILGKLEQLA